MAELRNVLGKKKGGRGASSRGFVGRIGFFVFRFVGDATQVTPARNPNPNPHPNPEACLVGVPWGRCAWKGSSCYAGTSKEVRLRGQIYARWVLRACPNFDPNTGNPGRRLNTKTHAQALF